MRSVQRTVVTLNRPYCVANLCNKRYQSHSRAARSGEGPLQRSLLLAAPSNRNPAARFRRSYGALSVSRPARVYPDAQPDELHEAAPSQAPDLDPEGEIDASDQPGGNEDQPYDVIEPDDLSPPSDDLLKDLWPFLSPMDEVLTFPRWKHLETQSIHAAVDENAGSRLEARDAALLASAATELPAECLQRLEGDDARALLKECSAGVLTSLVTGLAKLPASSACSGLRRRAAEELLKRRHLRLRHAACLLAALGTAGDREGASVLPVAPVLKVVADVLDSVTREELSHSDAAAALEGLARARKEGVDASTDELLVSISSKVLASHLGGGGGLMRLILLSQECALGTRVLAALLHLPEAIEQTSTVSWLASMLPPRWPRELLPGSSEEQVAAAACTLAQCGVFTSARCHYLLMQAMRRNSRAQYHEGDGALPPEAGCLWLYAVAKAGKSLDEVTKIDCQGPLLDSAEWLSLPASGDDAGKLDVEVLARTLWALCSLGKREERGLGEALLERLSEADASTFSTTTWSLLKEVRTVLTDTGAPGLDVFDTEPWQSGLGVSEDSVPEAA